ncbi:MAG: sensor histidine kinase [Candidatus Zixiibacteriota bacterium]
MDNILKYNKVLCAYYSVDDYFWIWNIEDGKITYDKHLVEDLGYGKSDAGDISWWRDKLTNEDGAQLYELISHTDAETNNINHILKIRAKDGKYRCYWLKGRISSFDEDGKPDELFAIFRDITEIKNIQEQKDKRIEELETLIRETHHRIKNNLQIVSSLMNLQAKASKNDIVESILINTKSRIETIAILHENLYKYGNIKLVDMKTYFHDLIEYISNSYQPTASNCNFFMDIDDIDLEISKAISCGLILHEFVTNAIKHAFDDFDGDKYIYISFKKRKKFYHLKVSDNGNSLPDDFCDRKFISLGLQLVKMIVKQLKSEFEINISKKIFEIILPLDMGGENVSAKYTCC